MKKQQLSQEAIQATREHFAANQLKCIMDAYAKRMTCDLMNYIARREQDYQDYLSGKHDTSFTFVKRANQYK